MFQINLSVPQSKWKKDGRTLTKSIKYNFSPAGSLFIANVNEIDAGRYECTVTNEMGRATASCVITVRWVCIRFWSQSPKNSPEARIKMKNLWSHLTRRKREDLAPGDKFVRVAFSEASSEVDAAINQTVASLFSPDAGGSSPKNHGDLFRIVRFPTGPARELARASEIYERTLVNIRKHINAGKNLTTNMTDNFEYDDLNTLSTEYLELLAQLSDCTAHRVNPNCTDMCYHNKYRTIDGSCNNLQHPLWGSSLSAFRR